MKHTLTYNVILGYIITCICSVSAQDIKISNSNHSDGYETINGVDNYLELKKLGYQEREIFEDLGNANFLTQNYEIALFWYEKLKEISKNNTLDSSYDLRYHYALEKTNATSVATISDNKDWLEQIKADYQIDQRPLKKKNIQSFASVNQVSGLEENPADHNRYRAPMATTANGNTAYFSKAVYVKPLYGIFSKKELVHKIYKADKIDGEWKNIKEIALCPKNYSALHPTISDDGKRLFFASDMPGTFGEYDIYVSTMQSDGSFGRAKNLGEKVNTKKNDLYPKIVDGNTLFFASEGRKGYGGLDVYMAQVGHKKVSWAVNLGTPINSAKDDFSISLGTEKGMGYVVSNRGTNKDTVHKVAFSYADPEDDSIQEKRDYTILAALSNDIKVDYSASVFEDE